MSRRFTPTQNSQSSARRACLSARTIALRLRARVVLGVAIAASMVALAGCSSSRTYEGRTRDEVWQAMVGAAQSPRYRDWVVIENQVWTDDADLRIEMLRELKRDVVLPGQGPYREEAEWRLTGRLQPGEPPVVLFSTSDLCVPAHFWLQADHYFDEVHSRLMVPPPPAPPVSVPIDDPMILPPSSLTESADRRDDILDSVPAIAPKAPDSPPAPTPAPPRGGRSEPLEVP